MDANVLIAIISFAGTLLGTFAGIITSSKLSNYRIEQLEKKVDKHNGIIERTYTIEEKVSHIFYEIDEIKDYIQFQEKKSG